VEVSIAVRPESDAPPVKARTAGDGRMTGVVVEGEEGLREERGFPSRPN